MNTGLLRKIKKAALLLMVLGCLISVSPKTSAATPGRWKKILNKYRNKKNTNRLILVKYTGGTRCRVVMYKKVKKKNGTYKWTKLVGCNGYVGQNGIWKQREGDRKTPVGTFRVTEAFGVLPNPGTKIKYTRLNADLYWSGEAGTYNTMVNWRTLGHIPANSEHLIDYQPHYNYALNMGYNRKNVFGKGSALFLHCFGNYPYTGGCVAVSQEHMKQILRYTTKKTRICIYPKK